MSEGYHWVAHESAFAPRLATTEGVTRTRIETSAQVLNAAIATLERRHTAQDSAAAKLAALSERLSLVEEASSAWAERQVGDCRDCAVVVGTLMLVTGGAGGTAAESKPSTVTAVVQRVSSKAIQCFGESVEQCRQDYCEYYLL